MFCIVEFEDDHTVEVIPTSWLRDAGKKCLWPPVRQTHIVAKWTKERHEPEDSWSSYSVRVLLVAGSAATPALDLLSTDTTCLTSRQTRGVKPCLGTYDEARRKLSSAEYTSDLQSQAEVDEGGVKKYSQRKKHRSSVRIWDSSESDVEPCARKKSKVATARNDQVNSKDRPKKFADAPVIGVPLPDISRAHKQTPPSAASEKRQSATISTDEQQSTAFPGDAGSMTPTRLLTPRSTVPISYAGGSPLVVSSPVSPRHSVSEFRSPRVTATSTSSRTASSSRSVVSSTPVAAPRRSPRMSPSKYRNPQSSSDCTSRGSPRNLVSQIRNASTSISPASANIPEFEKKVLTALESLKVAVEHNSRALQQIINTSSAVSDVHELSSDVTLPVKSIRELQLLDDKLEDDENFGKALLAKLAIIGGDDLKSTVKRTMACVLANAVQRQLNWCGRGKKGKIGFQNFRMKTVIYKAVRRNPACQRPSEQEFEKVAREWLRLSGDRDGGRKSRRQ